MTYQAMVIAAVTALDDRNGVSLQAIRKYIQSNFILKSQQTASFNSLTLKAISKAVAMNEVEKINKAYRLSAVEREKRKKKIAKDMKDTNVCTVLTCNILKIISFSKI